MNEARTRHTPETMPDELRVIADGITEEGYRFTPLVLKDAADMLDRLRAALATAEERIQEMEEQIYDSVPKWEVRDLVEKTERERDEARERGRIAGMERAAAIAEAYADAAEQEAWEEGEDAAQEVANNIRAHIAPEARAQGGGGGA